MVWEVLQFSNYFWIRDLHFLFLKNDYSDSHTHTHTHTHTYIDFYTIEY